MIKAVIFDLGGTLIRYKDVPLSWTSLYRDAIYEIASKCNKRLNEGALDKAVEILSKYNTRINPRKEEVEAATIFGEILDEWHIADPVMIAKAIEGFFSFFQRKN